MSRPLMEGGKVLFNPRGPLFSTQSFGDSEIWILMLVQVQDHVITIVYLFTNMHATRSSYKLLCKPEKEIVHYADDLVQLNPGYHPYTNY